MDWNAYFDTTNEQPLDRFAEGISHTAIFRTIGFVGDSLSSGEFESRSAEGKADYHDYYEYSWGQYIARKNGLKAYNFSRGGMSAKWYMESYAEEQGFWDPEKACQAYVIALGVNDVINGRQTIGSTEDICPTDYIQNAKSFAGYYAQIIQRLKLIQPKAKFFLVTMPRAGDDRDDDRRAVAELLHSFAEYFDNTYVIDLFRYAPIYDAQFKERFWLYGHLNASGYIFTANMIDAYIDYIVRHHPEDFRRVPYIGKDLR